MLSLCLFGKLKYLLQLFLFFTPINLLVSMINSIQDMQVLLLITIVCFIEKCYLYPYRNTPE